MPILGTIASSRQVAATSGYFSIASYTGNGSSNSVTFSSIPQTYRHLELHLTVKSTHSSSSGYTYIHGTVNGDTGANYTDNRIVGRSADSFVGTVAYTNSLWLFGSAVSTETALNNYFGAGYMRVTDYSKNDRYKEWFSLSGMETNGNGGTNLSKGSIWLMTSKWKNTAPITDLTFALDYGNYASGTTIALYGIV